MLQEHNVHNRVVVQVIVKDQFTKDVKTGICNNDGVITFMLGPVPKKHLNGVWPTDGFTNNLIITANEIGGNLKAKVFLA